VIGAMSLVASGVQIALAVMALQVAWRQEQTGQLQASSA
jgi:hypothetical protein